MFVPRARLPRKALDYFEKMEHDLVDGTNLVEHVRSDIHAAP